MEQQPISDRLATLTFENEQLKKENSILKTSIQDERRRLLKSEGMNEAYSEIIEKIIEVIK